MKRLFLIIAAICTFAGAAQAQKLVEGDLTFLQDVTELQVEITWDGTIIEGKTEEEYISSRKEAKEEGFETWKMKWYEEDRAVMRNRLTEAFTGSLKKRSEVTVTDTARYKVIFNIDRIEFGIVYPSTYTSTWSTIHFVDTETGETMAVMTYEKMRSGTEWVVASTKYFIADKLGNTTAKWLVKNKYINKK